MNPAIRHRIFGMLLIAASALSFPAEAADSSPTAFVASVYGSPKESGAPLEIPCNPADRAEIRRQFEPAAAELVSWSLKHADGCVFTGLDGSEDWVADSVDIATTQSDHRHAVGTVTLMVHGKTEKSAAQKSTIVLKLVRSGGSWRIADIDYGENTLSQIRDR